MANVSDYMFNNLTRIGNDTCDQSEENLQNIRQANYMLTNYYSTDCMMKKGMQTALMQPNINYKGTHQVGFGGCNINTNSALTLGQLQTIDKCKLDLQTRPFATVPYLGRGSGDVVIESRLVQGEMNTCRKSVAPVTEQSYMPYTQTTLLPELSATINNPANLIEGVAEEGWIRGGLPSRELTKDYDYFTSKTQYQY